LIVSLKDEQCLNPRSLKDDDRDIEGDFKMNRKKQFAIFVSIWGLFAAAGCIHESVFNNFLDDVHGISEKTRGFLEFPRELPGLAVVVMTGILAALPVTHLGVVGFAILAAGLMGLAFLGGEWWPMLCMMVLASVGLHLLQPVGTSIAIGLADERTRGKRLGQMGGISTLGAIAGTGFVWMFFRSAESQYRTAFLVAAGIAAIAGGVMLTMHIPHLHQRRARFIIKKRFRLYYLLEMLFGARKQVFITFGPWVLIKIYNRGPADIAQLIMIASILGLACKPLAGIAIDRFGERAILILDGLLLILVCVGYGFATKLMWSESAALAFASGCYVLDNLLFSLGTGRAVYASRLSESPQELTSTLSVGISINHIISMIIPAGAGLLWAVLGYEYVFLAAAVLAIIISITASFISRHKGYPEQD
jgi:predicted MFS family arabinose efflux permease